MSLYWYLLPVVITVSLVHHATRYETPELILRRSLGGVVYILGFLGAVFAFLYFLSWQLDNWIYQVALLVFLIYYFFPRRRSHRAPRPAAPAVGESGRGPSESR